MQIRPAQVVLALDIARESFAAVERGDATVDQIEVVELASAARVHPKQVDDAVDVATRSPKKATKSQSAAAPANGQGSTT